MIIQVAIVSIWIVLCVYYLFYALIHRNLQSLKFVTIVLLLQNIMSLLSSNVFGRGVGQIIILYKEMVFWGVIIFALLIRPVIFRKYLPIIFFICFLIFEMLRGDASLYTKLICFRQLTTPVVLVCYAKSLRISESEKMDYVKFLVGIGLFQAIFGFLERFVLGDAFWLNLNIHKLFEAKGFDRWVMSGLPGNYYSYDFYHFTGTRIRRLVGITTDPLLTGHFLALCIVLLLFVNSHEKKYIRYFKLSIMTLACILTISKGAILIIAVAFIVKVWKKNQAIAYGMIGASIVGVFVIIRHNIFRTVKIHIEGLITALASCSLLGGGLGTSGNLSSLSGQSSTSGESFLGMVLGQTGVFGTILYVFLLFYLIKLILKYKSDTQYRYAIMAYVLAVILESCVSESSISFVGSGCAFILVGLLSHRMMKKDEIKDTNYEKRNFNISQSI